MALEAITPQYVNQIFKADEQEALVQVFVWDRSGKMDRLDSYFKAYNKIDEQSEREIIEVNPRSLINHRRIDIIVKYYYIKARETGEDLEFAKELYMKHIEAFTDGTFQEHGNIRKNTIEQYMNTFNVMIDHFKEEGYDSNRSIIPIGRNNEILDGAHRTACALYFNTPVKVMKFPELSVDYGFNFFKARLLDAVYLDFIAKYYVQSKNNVAVAILWPKVGNKENMRHAEKEFTQEQIQIVYRKKLKLSEKNMRDLVYGLYHDEHWIGLNPDKSEAINYKVDHCYDEKGDLAIYLLEGMEAGQLTKVKEKLRDDFQVEKSSIHTTDTHKEAIEIVNFLLDEDYGGLLHQNYIDRKDVDHTIIRFMHRKLRYYYRKSINQIKRIIGKPV